MQVCSVFRIFFCISANASNECITRKDVPCAVILLTATSAGLHVILSLTDVDLVSLYTPFCLRSHNIILHFIALLILTKLS